MGISYQDARMLWEARLRGVSFETTITIAHLSLFLHSAEAIRLRQSYRASFPMSTLTPLHGYNFGDYSDTFLREFLGVTSLTVMDFSPSEGADTIHDLNQAVPETLCGRFDAVIDSGSLEHVFNFPVAITTLMKMVRVGGSIFITTPANNLCGHGFYQFSPELMFRVFADENGFKLKRLLLFEAGFPSIELTSNVKAYEVADPVNVQSRVGLMSTKPVMMMVEAKKIAEVPLFTRAPLQSDYVSQWKQSEARPQHTGIGRIGRSVLARLPFFVRARLRGYIQTRHYSFSNTRFYKKIRGS
jgi:hypothetical protein